MERYRHFKGQRYQIITLAEKEDTGEQLVIYQALYGDGKVYARSLDDFLSEVDREKYPDAVQRYRFERIVPEEEEKHCGEQEAEEAQDAGHARSERTDTSAGGAAASEEEQVSKQEQASLDEKSMEDLRRRSERADEKNGEMIDSSAARRSESVPSAEEQQAEAARENRNSDCADSRGQGETSESNAETDQEETAVLDPLLEAFLDARTTEEKLTALDEMRGRVTDEMIDTMALCCGVEVGPGPTVSRYEDLRDCLVTIEKYELERGRLRG